MSMLQRFKTTKGFVSNCSAKHSDSTSTSKRLFQVLNSGYPEHGKCGVFPQLIRRFNCKSFLYPRINWENAKYSLFRS